MISRWLRDAAAAVRPQGAHEAVDAIADFAIEYTNVISAAMTSEYVAHTRLIEAAEGDRGAELLNIMLSGYDESDGRIARLLKSAGYLDQRQSYCVVGVQTPIPGELENPERANRILASLADLFAPTNIRVLAGLRDLRVIAIASALRRQSGWTAPQTSLAERLTSLLMQLGPSVLVGVSADRPSTAWIPKALREAAAALDFASVDRRVVLFSALPVRSLLVHAGGEYVRSAAPSWIASLLAADGKAGGDLCGRSRRLPTRISMSRRPGGGSKCTPTRSMRDCTGSATSPASMASATTTLSNSCSLSNARGFERARHDRCDKLKPSPAFSAIQWRPS